MLIAGTGSRSFDLEKDHFGYDHLIDTVAALYVEDDNLILMSGMAEGWDEAIAKVALGFEIPFKAVVPNPGYGKYYWGEHSVTGRDRGAEFNELIDQAQQVIYVCASIYQDGVHANLLRNQYMVNEADHFLVWHAPSRGKEDCLRRIQAANKPYTIIGTNSVEGV